MDNKIVLHKRSSVIKDGKPKLPTKEQIDYGELAINYAKDAETLSIRNNNDDIIAFVSEVAVDKKIEEATLSLYLYWTNIDCVSTVDDPLTVIADTIDSHKKTSNLYVCMAATTRNGDTVTPNLTATTVTFSNSSLSSKYGEITQGDVLYYGGSVDILTVNMDLWQRLTEYEAKSAVDGLMSKEDKNNLTQLLSDVAALQNKTRYIGDGMVLKANDTGGYLNWDKDSGVYFNDANLGDQWASVAGTDGVPMCFVVTTTDGTTYQYCINSKTGVAYYRHANVGDGSLGDIDWTEVETAAKLSGVGEESKYATDMVVKDTDGGLALNPLWDCGEF